MKDYRLKENRHEYFTALYTMTLEHRISPGLVYLYMPALAERLGWDDEQKLWFAFLNGLCQNPITSLVMMEQLPHCPLQDGGLLLAFEQWFNENWALLQFDTDRQKNKRSTVQAIASYAALVENAGEQVSLWADRSYEQCWQLASSIHSFGRLSTFSFLEYVHLNGLGPQCTDLMFNDKEGSRSHRNGMLFLHGYDELVWDKRINNGCTGKYKNFEAMCRQMDNAARVFLFQFQAEHGGLPDIGNFTFESALCQFKNAFFSRRYPGVYSDMALERIEWAEAHGWERQAKVFRQIREEHLPQWLRMECEDKGSALPVKQRAAMFAETGFPFRGEYFL